MPENLEFRGKVWHLRYMHKGKVHRKSTGVHDLARAKRRATAMKKEIQDGSFGWLKPTAPTFTTWATQFLNKHYPLGTGSFTLDDRREPGSRGYVDTLILRRAAAVFGPKRLDTLKQSDFIGYFRQREVDGAAMASIERERVVLKMLYRLAVADKVVTDNPLVGIPKFKAADPRERLLTRENEVLIRAAALPEWVRYMTVALGTGLRAKELRMARPCDLRHKGTWLFVRPDANKRKTSREVPLSPGVMTALKEQAAAREGDDKTPYWNSVTNVSAFNYFKALCKKLKIQQVSPHDFRHTFATRWVERNGNLKNLQTVLGHKDIKLTMSIYVKFNSGSVRDSLIGVTE